MALKRVLIALAAAPVLLAFAAPQAQAATKATAPATAAATTLKWSATLVDQNGNLLTGKNLSVSSVASLGRSYYYFSVRNTGTTGLTGQAFTVNAGGLTLASLALDACTGGAWSSGSCTGTTQPITMASGSVHATLPIATGADLSVRLTMPTGLLTTVTIGVSVTDDDVRDPTTRNS